MEENLYAIIGENLFLVENETEKIIDNLNVDPFNILTYDLEETELQEFLQEITTVSLLADKKVLKVKNPWFFYEKRDANLLPLIRYFKNPKTDTVLIFMLEKDVNQQFLISKEAKKYLRFEIVEQLEEKEMPNYVKKYFKQLNYEIDNDAVNEVLGRVDYDYQMLHNELNKLELLRTDTKKISFNDVQLLVPRNLEENLFELSTAVIEDDKERALKCYYDLLVRSVDPVAIIGNLANKIKETITTKHLLSQGMSQQSVADYFRVSNGRAYYMVKSAKNQNFNNLEKSYSSLNDLDYKIKSGQIEKKLGLELWLLEGFNVKK